MQSARFFPRCCSSCTAYPVALAALPLAKWLARRSVIYSSFKDLLCLISWHP